MHCVPNPSDLPLAALSAQPTLTWVGNTSLRTAGGHLPRHLSFKKALPHHRALLPDDSGCRSLSFITLDLELTHKTLKSGTNVITPIDSSGPKSLRGTARLISL